LGTFLEFFPCFQIGGNNNNKNIDLTKNFTDASQFFQFENKLKSRITLEFQLKPTHQEGKKL
jgi:hypothetical protein